MISLSPPTEELTELLEASCLGELTATQQRRLRELVCSDGECRFHYVLFMHMHALVERREGQAGKHVPELLDAGCDELSEPVTPPLSAISPAFGNAMHSATAYFSSGWPMAYLVATVIMLATGVVAWSWKLPGNTQIASGKSGTGSLFQDGSKGASLPSPLSPFPSIVGRITGMVDCRWANANTAVPGPVAVPLGRKYALASGLLEITYDSGAKVILQGPCTYEVESPTGGFLSLGKLTARVEKNSNSPRPSDGRGAGGEGSQQNGNRDQSQRALTLTLSQGERGPDSRSSFLIPHSYFAVRTPTATVTDLGTEFGVEVSDGGATTSHVFQGTVDVQFVGNADKRGQAVRLTANESVCVDKHGTTTRQPTANNMAFVRSLRQQPDGKEVPVANGGFEIPALMEQHRVDADGGWYRQDADTPIGWQKIGTAGVVTGGNAPIRPNLTDGGQWGFCNGKSESNPIAGVLYQAVATIDAAADYTLSVEMAVQTHFNSVSYKLSLCAGEAGQPTVEVASVSGRAYVNPKRAMVISHAAENAAYAGQTLFIRMEGIEDDKQILFDNVRVTAHETSNRPQATKVLQSPNTRE